MTVSTRSIVAPALIAALALMPAGLSAQQSRGSSTRPGTPAALGIHGFSVVLVVGSLSGTGAASSESVPEAARKALADMKDFLPFKRYQLLDAAWMLCCASRSGVSGRVRGPDEREYRFQVEPISVGDGKLDVRFSIRDVGTSIFEPALRTPSQSPTANHPQAVEAAREHAQGQSASSRSVIDSTFSISLGETVVVGTSRLNGDRALIAILTAAGKPKTNP